MIICFAACSFDENQEVLSPRSANESMPQLAKLNDPITGIGPAICPEDMQHVSGLYCNNVDQKCIKYVDPPTNKFARCAEFAPSVCIGSRINMDFCIDTEEHHPADSNMPSSDVSWNQAEQVCVQEGKKLCLDSQWTFACEGTEMYPYTTGNSRPSGICNFDIPNLLGSKGEFINQSLPITKNPQCVSPFGVHNMNGNVDEWIVLEHPYTPKKGIRMMSGLKGGWWGGMRDRCRPVTVGHNETFHELQIGFRCCKETQ